jgi:hypothetical protein
LSFKRGILAVPCPHTPILPQSSQQLFYLGRDILGKQAAHSNLLSPSTKLMNQEIKINRYLGKINNQKKKEE